MKIAIALLLIVSTGHAFGDRPKEYKHPRRICGFTNVPFGCGGPSTPTIEFNSTEFVKVPQSTCFTIQSRPGSGYYCVNVIDEVTQIGPKGYGYFREVVPTGEFEYDEVKTEVRRAKRYAENQHYCGDDKSFRPLHVRMKGKVCFCISGNFICN